MQSFQQLRLYQFKNFINALNHCFFMAEKKRSSIDSASRTLRESAFLADVLKLKMEEYVLSVNISHFIATISGIILTLSLGKMVTSGFAAEEPLVKLGIASIVVSSLVTILLMLLTVEPAIKKDRDSNTFDYGTKLAELSLKDYISTIKRNIEKRQNMIDSYGHELHKLDNVILRRFKMIKSAISIFIFGIFLGGMLILISTLV